MWGSVPRLHPAQMEVEWLSHSASVLVVFDVLVIHCSPAENNSTSNRLSYKN
ncbi:hypothetical protein AALO_G00145090, partial [Alosa alosa]